MTVLCGVMLVHIAHGATVPGSEQLRGKAEEVLSSLVTVIIYDKAGGESARGRGIFIDSKGRILVQDSLLDGAYSAEVFSTWNYYWDVTVLNRDQNRNLGLIRVEAIDENPVEFAFGYTASPGETVVAAARLPDSQKIFAEGVISNVSAIGDTMELIQVQTVEPLRFFYDMSNSPLLNADGKIIGVLTGTLSDNNSLYAVSIRSIEPFLLSSGERQHLHPGKSKVWFWWFLKFAFIKLFFEIKSWMTVSVILLAAALIAVIQWGYGKLKKSRLSG